jgi:cysteine peptidase C11 family protein
MTTHFKPANTAIQEMKPWELEAEAGRLAISNPKAKYAVIMVMAGDSSLGNQVLPDIAEMGLGTMGGDEVSVVALVDLGSGTLILEVTDGGRKSLLSSPSIDTGDPRPIAAFLTLALNSYSEETRIALGFWGHGSGVFGDLDPRENLLPEELLAMPLGTKLTEGMFLEHYLSEPMPIKGLINRGMLPDQSTGGVLTNRELSSALTVAFSKTGRTEPVDLLFFDTCQNGAIEVYAEMRRYCKVFIASCLTIPGLGWNYTWFLQMTRRLLPKSAEGWGLLAIEAYNKTYDQELYPRPVQLVALKSESEILEKFRGVAEELTKLPAEEYTKLMVTSGALHSIVHNESVDVCTLALFLSGIAKHEELTNVSQEFVKAYQAALVAVSDPPNNGKSHSGLSVWCPRLGDKVSVSEYYENLRFHKETGWFDAVRQIWLREKDEKKAPPGLQMVSVQKPDLVEERKVEETGAKLEGYEDGPYIGIRVGEATRRWSGELKEGVYRFLSVDPAEFRSLDEARKFFDVLYSVRRKEEEFAVFEVVCDNDVVMDQKAVKRLFAHLVKYEKILMDEFPEWIKVYSVVRELVENAAKDGLLLMGRFEAE